MLVTQVNCPHCAKHLRTTKPLAVGKQVQCPHCRASFAVPPEPTASPVPSKNAVTVPSAGPPPQRSRGKKRPGSIRSVAARKSARKRMLIGATFAGLLLLMALTAGLTLYYAVKQNRNPPLAAVQPAANSAPAPEAPEAREEPAP